MDDEKDDMPTHVAFAQRLEAILPAMDARETSETRDSWARQRPLVTHRQPTKILNCSLSRERCAIAAAAASRQNHFAFSTTTTKRSSTLHITPTTFFFV
jgi:hypothetical protein